MDLAYYGTYFSRFILNKYLKVFNLNSNCNYLNIKILKGFERIKEISLIFYKALRHLFYLSTFTISLLILISCLFIENFRKS